MVKNYGITDRMECNYANIVINNNKIVYGRWHNCSIYRHNFEHNRLFLSTAQKHS